MSTPSTPTYDYGPYGPNALPYQQADTSYSSGEYPEPESEESDTAGSYSQQESALTGYAPSDGYYGQEDPAQQGYGQEDPTQYLQAGATDQDGYAPSEEQAGYAPSDGYYGQEDPAQQDGFSATDEGGVPQADPALYQDGFSATDQGGVPQVDPALYQQAGYGDPFVLNSASADFGAETNSATESGVDIESSSSDPIPRIAL